MIKTKLFFLTFFVYVLLFTTNILAQPTITLQPQGQTILEGTSATFVLTATGVDPLTYQWYKNGVAIGGAILSNYTTPPTTIGDDGSTFYCEVSDINGTTTSSTVTLNITAGVAPSITVQPTNKYILTDQTATFSLTAAGTPTLLYQWKKNNVDIAGATSASYTTPAAILSDDGSLFTCVVTNGFGTVTSDVAVLSVADASTRIANGLQVLYDFDEGSGTTINDVSNVGSDIDLEINDLDLASWTDKGLNVHDDVNIRSSGFATKVIDAVKASNEITYEAWILPTNVTTRNFFTRLITIEGDNPSQRNFGVTQFKDNFYYLLRTTNSDLGGGDLGIDTAFASLTHIAVTRRADGSGSFYQNGVLVGTSNLTGDLSNWADNYFVVLGNATTGSRYWEGTYYLTAVYDRALSTFEINHNYNIGISADEKPSFAVNPKDQFALEDDVVSFSALAISTSSVSYQWKKNDVNIPGETNSTLIFQAMGADDGAVITCSANSAGGTTTSQSAILNVTSSNSRVTAGQKVLYNFKEGSGSTINDISGAGSPINLNIFSTEAINWSSYGLEITSAPSILTTAPAQKLIDAGKASNSLSIEAWVLAANNTQDGPASIVNLSANSSSRNFSLAQTADSFNVRLRTTSTNDNGEPSLSTIPGTVSTTEFDHIVYTWETSGTAKIYLNGTERVSQSIGGDLSNWENHFLSLGNEVGGGAPWLGVINLVAVFDRTLSQSEILRNFNFGPYGFVEDPSGLMLVANEIGSVSLSWTDNSTNEDGFLVERGVGDPIVYSVLDTLAVDSTSYVDNSVEDNTQYTYRIKAFNSIGESMYSNVVVVQTLISPITKPSGINYTLDTDGYPILTWEDNSDNETNFVIERRESGIGGEFAVVDTVGENVTTYKDLTVMDSTTYIYKLFAFNADTSSDYSDDGFVEVLTDVGEIQEIPTEFSLAQNYPNPFNPSTTIKFGLPENSEVTIALFNMLGQRVFTLSDQDYAAGKHSLLFDASKLTSGIYIYSITAKGQNGNNFVQTKKMVLLK